ncbi:MAG: hypothetical protein AAGK32_11840, partial [Actinomycetota bacterium]
MAATVALSLVALDPAHSARYRRLGGAEPVEGVEDEGHSEVGEADDIRAAGGGDGQAVGGDCRDGGRPLGQLHRQLDHAGSSDVIGLTNLGVPLVLHPLDRLGPIESWIEQHSVRYGRLTEIYYVRGPGQLTTEQYWHLQSAANGFRVDQLQGVAGQGLPVIRQPLGERPIGMARIDGAFEFGSQPPPAYWTRQGQTLRR